MSDMGMPPSMYPQSHVGMGIGMGMGIREHINGRQNEMIPGYYNGGGMVDSGFMPDSDQSPIMEVQ